MMPVRFSTSRNSKPPASLVMDPPSNCPRTSRCFRGLNGNGSWLHSVVIRLSPFVGVTATLNIFYATKRQPLLFFNEKCGLVGNDGVALYDTFDNGRRIGLVNVPGATGRRRL